MGFCQLADDYYEKPDGEDCPRKVFLASRWTGSFGFLFGTMDLLMKNQPKTVFDVMYRYHVTVTPAATFGAVGAMAVCFLTRWRGVDDPMNHFFGSWIGATAGGAILGRPGVGIGLGLIAAPIMLICKYYRTVEPMPVLHDSSFRFCPEDHWTIKRNCSLIKQYPPEWKAADQ